MFKWPRRVPREYRRILAVVIYGMQSANLTQKCCVLTKSGQVSFCIDHRLHIDVEDPPEE